MNNTSTLSSTRVYNLEAMNVSVVMAAPVPVAPEVGVSAFASPTEVLELDTHSLSEDDPSESSLPPVSVAPMVSPFLCSDDSE
ncbi:hypothetical protein Tco_0685762 [Tanacetum coccineum]